MNTSTTSEYIDYKALFARYGFKPGTAYALVHQRRIPHVRLSKRLVLFKVADIDAWLALHLVAAIEAETNDRPKRRRRSRAKPDPKQ